MWKRVPRAPSWAPRRQDPIPPSHPQLAQRHPPLSKEEDTECRETPASAAPGSGPFRGDPHPALPPSPQEKVGCREHGVISEPLNAVLSQLGDGAWQGQEGPPVRASALLSASARGQRAPSPGGSEGWLHAQACGPGSAPSAHRCWPGGGCPFHQRDRELRPGHLSCMRVEEGEARTRGHMGAWGEWEGWPCRPGLTPTPCPTLSVDPPASSSEAPSYSQELEEFLAGGCGPRDRRAQGLSAEEHSPPQGSPCRRRAGFWVFTVLVFCSLGQLHPHANRRTACGLRC